MKLSVIIPAYNAEKTIGRCLNSIINQTYRNFEIIIINDGSIDNTDKILRKYNLIDSRISFYNKENGGVSSARNKGIDISEGEFITFIDSDDYIDKDYFEKLMDLIESNTLDFVMCGIKKEDIKGKILSQMIPTQGIAKNANDIGQQLNFMDKSFVYGKIYRTKIIKNNGIKFNETMSLGEDTLFVMDYLYHVRDGVGSINESLYHYVNADISSLSKKYHSNIKQIYETIYEANNRLCGRFESYIIPYKKEVLITTMDIQNMYVISSPLTRKERVENIRKYMNDLEIRKAYIQSNPKSKIDILRKYLILSRLSILVDIVYSTTVKIKNYNNKYVK